MADPAEAQTSDCPWQSITTAPKDRPIELCRSPDPVGERPVVWLSFGDATLDPRAPTHWRELQEMGLSFPHRPSTAAMADGANSP
jgi:hypothetical protein